MVTKWLRKTAPRTADRRCAWKNKYLCKWSILFTPLWPANLTKLLCTSIWKGRSTRILAAFWWRAYMVLQRDGNCLSQSFLSATGSRLDPNNNDMRKQHQQHCAGVDSPPSPWGWAPPLGFSELQSTLVKQRSEREIKLVGGKKGAFCAHDSWNCPGSCQWDLYLFFLSLLMFISHLSKFPLNWNVFFMFPSKTAEWLDQLMLIWADRWFIIIFFNSKFIIL